MLRRVVAAGCVVLAGAGGADGAISVSGGLTRDLHLAPGRAYEGTLEILSALDRTQTVRLYQTDYTFFADGSNHYDEAGSTARSNAAWIVFSPHEVEIPPHGAAEVFYQITVPDDSTLVGTYWSMLMIEPVSDEPPPAPASDAPSLGVRMVVRHGLQISVTVDGAGETRVQPRGSLTDGDTGPVLQLDLENSGVFLVRPDVWAEIYDETGEKLVKATSEAKRIFPGCSVRHKLALDVPSGAYQALIVIDNGGGEVWGTRYNLDIP